MRLINPTSKTIDVTSGVRVSLLGPLLFCSFINDIPEVLKFSSRSIFANDLKVLAIVITPKEVQEKVLAVERLVKNNKKEPAAAKCAQNIFQGSHFNQLLRGETLSSPHEITDLGITVCRNLSWSAHINARLKKANRILYAIRRNVAFKV